MLISILAFLAILSILVVVHEFGHFLLARILGIGVEEFAVGLPLTGPLWSKVLKDGLRISIYPTLFGGFVRLSGEEYDESSVKVAKNKAQFWNKPVWVRVSVIVAGVVANMILAVVAFSLVIFFTGIPIQSQRVKIVAVSAGGPAEVAGIKPGDVVVGAEEVPLGQSEREMVVGKAFTSADQFIEFVNSLKGKNLEIELQRDGKPTLVNVIPRVDPPKGEGSLGVAISDVELQFPPFLVRLVQSLKLGILELWFWVKLTTSGVGYLFSQLVLGKVPEDLVGPLGIAQMSGKVANQGILAVVEFLGILSVNLAILNILPIPALDGGRVLFIVLEKLFGRRVAPRVEHMIHTVGMVVLLTFMLFITMRDVERWVKDSGVLKKIFISQ